MSADDDSEVGLPQKGINMIIKDVLPDVRVANETRELLNQCCVEFVRHLSKEAQTIASKDQRKTIYHEHVQKALANLGFPLEYQEAANSVLGECRQAAEQRLRRKHSRLDKCGIPEEQLYLMQQALIERARREEAERLAALNQQISPPTGSAEDHVFSPNGEGLEPAGIKLDATTSNGAQSAPLSLSANTIQQRFFAEATASQMDFEDYDAE